ncbi:unnamed protein product [Porites evermanni]|uniref:Uncharacterized protein n=1 Tax=Porites evermanni TaxID=104178 RepID=A0ABN8LD50_9CNID|nr:unnamed protein product [Porites evermanni]
MSAGTRRRLQDALNAGKDIESTSAAANGVSKLSSVQIDFGDVMGIYGVNFSYNTQCLVAGCGNGAIQVYACDTGRKRRPLKHGSLYGLPITAVKFFPYKDDQLITASADGTMTCWDLESWNVFKTVDEPHNEISALDFSHDGKIFATAGKQSWVTARLSQWTTICTYILLYQHSGTETKQMSRGPFLESPGVMSTGPKISQILNIFLIVFHFNCCLKYSQDRKIRVYDTSTLQVKLTFGGTDDLASTQQGGFAPEAGHGRKVFAVRFHPFDDNIFLTGGWDRCIKLNGMLMMWKIQQAMPSDAIIWTARIHAAVITVWDVRADQVVRSINGPYICGEGIDIWEDSVLTASWVAHDSLQVWDFGSGQLMEVIPFPSDHHGEFLYVGRFCGSGDLIAAGGSGTNDLKIIDRTKREVVSSVEDEGKPIQALDVSRNGNQLVIGSTGNCVQIVTLT